MVDQGSCGGRGKAAGKKRVSFNLGPALGGGDENPLSRDNASRAPAGRVTGALIPSHLLPIQSSGQNLSSILTTPAHESAAAKQGYTCDDPSEQARCRAVADNPLLPLQIAAIFWDKSTDELRSLDLNDIAERCVSRYLSRNLLRKVGADLKRDFPGERPLIIKETSAQERTPSPATGGPERSGTAAKKAQQESAAIPSPVQKAPAPAQVTANTTRRHRRIPISHQDWKQRQPPAFRNLQPRPGRHDSPYTPTGYSVLAISYFAELLRPPPLALDLPWRTPAPPTENPKQRQLEDIQESKPKRVKIC